MRNPNPPPYEHFTREHYSQHPNNSVLCVSLRTVQLFRISPISTLAHS
jgi:hypothetical protein